MLWGGGKWGRSGGVEAGLWAGFGIGGGRWFRLKEMAMMGMGTADSEVFNLIRLLLLSQRG